MSDSLGPPVRASWRDGTGRIDHPVLAGSLAVGLVAMLVLASHFYADPDGDAGVRTLCVLAGGAAVLFAAQLVLAPLSRRRSDSVAAPSGQARSGPTPVRHRCFVPANRMTTILTQDGRRLQARIAALSMATVTIEASMSERDYRSVCRVGAHEVGPVSRTATGAVFGFATMLDPQAFDRSFVL